MTKGLEQQWDKEKGEKEEVSDHEGDIWER